MIFRKEMQQSSQQIKITWSVDQALEINMITNNWELLKNINIKKDVENLINILHTFPKSKYYSLKLMKSCLLK